MATYVPDAGGEWIAAVRGTTILLAGATSSHDVLALWPHLIHPDPAAAVLDHVTAGGVSATPPFALVVRDPASASTLVVVRGPISVRVGDVEVDGAGVTTWTERVLPGGEVVVAGARGVAVAPIASGVGSGPFPIVEGIVSASEVRSSGVEAVAVPPAPVDERTVARDGASEQTMVPDEDTVVGVSVPVRPFTAPAGRVATQERIETPTDDPLTAPAAPSTLTIGTPPPSAHSATPASSTRSTPMNPPDPSVVEPAGDHDGLTIASDDIRRLREARAASAPAAGNANATQPDPGATEQVGLRMPDGTIEPVVDAVVIGRAPTIGKLSGGSVPRLVVIGAGDPDISRSHLRVAIEGGTVVVTDLDSRNGTHVVAPGRPPVKLRPAEPTPVLTDTVIDLGGGWSIQVVTR